MTTSVTKDLGKRFKSDIGVFIGDENGASASLVGLVSRDPGVEVVTTIETIDVYTVDKQGKLASDVTKRDAIINFTCLQTDAAVLGLALGVTEDGQVVTFGGSNEIQRRFSLKLTGSMADGTLQTLEFPVVTPIGSPTFTLNPDGYTMVSVSLAALEHVDNTYMWRWTAGAGNVVATLATGELTGVINLPSTYHKIASQVPGAADVMDILDGTVDVDGHVVTLQLNSITEPITFTDNQGGTNDLNLIGGNDYTMVSLSDFIKFQYRSSTTDWEETERYIS